MSNNETIAQYADRVVAAVRKSMLDQLDDDVISCLGESHLIFGKACAMEAISTAMREAGDMKADRGELASSNIGDQNDA